MSIAALATIATATFITNHRLSRQCKNLYRCSYLILGTEAILTLSRYFIAPKLKRRGQSHCSCLSNNPTVNLIFLECDQISMSSVESATKQFLSDPQRFDVLLCNAGMMGTSFWHQSNGTCSHDQTAIANATEHCSSTGDALIVFESSVGYKWTPSNGIRFDELKNHA